MPVSATGLPCKQHAALSLNSQLTSVCLEIDCVLSDALKMG